MAAKTPAKKRIIGRDDPAQQGLHFESDGDKLRTMQFRDIGLEVLNDLWIAMSPADFDGLRDQALERSGGEILAYRKHFTTLAEAFATAHPGKVRTPGVLDQWFTPN